MPDVRVEPTRVQLWDAQAAIEITSPLPGVLRLRHAPVSWLSSPGHPTLPTKRSWAVVGARAGELRVGRSDASVDVEAYGASLRLVEDPLAWSFYEGDVARARCLEARGQAVIGYPVPHYHTTLVLDAPPDEAWLGFGEKVGALDKRGQHFTFWNTDVLPHHPDTDPLYSSIPFFLAIRGGAAWGLLLDEPWRSEVDVALADSRRLRWDVFGPELDVYLFAGPQPADVLGRYAELTGRAPLPPLWSLGVHQSRWGYESSEDVLAIIRAYAAHRLPLDCVHLDIDHLEGFKVWTWDRRRFPDPRGLASAARQEGVKLVAIVDPGVKKEDGWTVYDEAHAHNFLVREDRGEPLVGEVWADPCVFPDFTSAEVRAWWAGLHRAHFEDGLAGIWNDMNEPSCFSVRRPKERLDPPTIPGGLPPTLEGKTLPYDARHGDKRHIEVHNVYGLAMCEASFEGFRKYAPERRPFVLTRAAFAGIQRYSAMWTGDNSSHWTHLEMASTMLMGLGVSGVPFCGADVPGFLGRPSGELSARWAQAAVFHPFFRFHSARGTPPKEPWRWGEPWLSVIRDALERRYRLLPTLYTLMREASRTGVPPLRALAIHFPGDRDALHADDQFLFGSDLLVAPVVRPGQTRRLAYVPEGAWLEWFNMAEPGAVAQGGRSVIAEAPLQTTPIWLRSGGGLTLAKPALHTTSAQWPELEWHVHAASSFSVALYEDAGEGYGPFRETRLVGEREGTRVRIFWQVQGDLPPTRAVERLQLYGLGARAARAIGARILSSSEAVTVLEVSTDAREVRLET